MVILGLFLSTVEKPSFAANEISNPTYSTVAPATMNFQFPFTNNFKLTVLPSLSQTPLHYVVNAGNGIDQVSVLLNNSDTYTITLQINYTLPIDGNLSYFIYSPHNPTIGDFVYFNATSVLLTKILVDAQLWIPPFNAEQEAQAILPLLGANISGYFTAENAQLQTYFGLFTAAIVIIFIVLGVMVLYIRNQRNDLRDEIQRLAKLERK